MAYMVSVLLLQGFWTEDVVYNHNLGSFCKDLMSLFLSSGWICLFVISFL